MNNHKKNLIIFGVIFLNWVVAFVFIAMKMEGIAILQAIIMAILIVWWAFKLVVKEEKIINV